MRIEYRSVFISDVHLGTRGCRADDLAAFLKRINCERLYLVGDIIDMWQLKQRWFWTPEHNNVIRQILRLSKNGTTVYYIPGNHDESARQYKKMKFGGVRIVLKAVHETADGRRLLITHGDQYDMVVTHARWLSKLGSWAYNWLLLFNRLYNLGRKAMGLSYWSLSQYIKLKVKKACTFISAYEDALVNEARRGGFDGVVCGHIHKAEVLHRDSMTYYNCGDWVESCTALVEHDDGTMRVIDGLAFVEQHREQKRALREAVAASALPVA